MSMRAALIKAFGEVYGSTPAIFEQDRITEDVWDSLINKFSSKQWRLGNEPNSTAVIHHRFNWGGVELHISVSSGKISEVTTYTDSLDTDIPELLSRILVGVDFTILEVTEAFAGFSCSDAEQETAILQTAEQIKAWFH